MDFDINADSGVRGMTLLNEMGDLEISWEPENDERVRQVIEKKMREGVRFFVLKPIIGDMLHMRRKMKTLDDLKGQSVKINDADIEKLFSGGNAHMFRNQSGQSETVAVASVKDADGKQDHAASSAVAVRHRTVAVRPLSGG